MCDPIRAAGKTQLMAELNGKFTESWTKHMIADNTRSLDSEKAEPKDPRERQG